ncbi:MAG: metal-dependent hydrolase [Candidatus Nezhaarchaeales archaeon]
MELEPLIHFVAPFVVLALFGVKLRKALPISLLALLPDLDALFLLHRSLSHSIVIALAVMMPLLLLTYRFKPRLLGYALLALFTVASHMVLDLFSGYTPILWPFCDHSVRVQAWLTVHVGSSLSLALSARLLTKPTTFQPLQSLDAPLFTGEGLILSSILLAPVLLEAVKRRHR